MFFPHPPSGGLSEFLFKFIELFKNKILSDTPKREKE